MLGLDALRGVAVFLMIEQHLGVWLWEGPKVGERSVDYLGLFIFNALGGGAAPAFVTLAGMGSSLLVQKRSAGPRSPDKTLIVRGLVVMAFGYALSLLTPSWFTMRSWFVLHLMGLGMLTTPLWRRLSTPTLLALGAGIIAVSGALQAHFEVPLALDNAYMAGRAPGSPQQWAGLRIALLEGQFPVFPWFSFYLAGLVAGRFVAAPEGLRTFAKLAAGALALGGVGLALRVLPSDPASALGRTTSLRVPFFPASPTLVALLLGVVLLGCLAVMAWDHRRPLSERNLLVTLGRSSLTLLLLHVWVFRELTRTDGWWQAHVGPLRWLGQHMAWWRALSAQEGLAVLATFLVFAVFASRAWQRVGYRYGAEWLLRKLSP
nr:DUF418 domain-containing transporter [Pseudenhygromyxa sp. WMMC2535]